MADITLFSRHSLSIGKADARSIGTCLLVYDEEHFTDEALSNDLREQLELDPTLSRIYVVAPRVSAPEIISQVRVGTSRLRPSQHENEEDPLLRIVVLNQTTKDGSLEPIELNFKENPDTRELEEEQCQLDANLIQGWLFNLFVQREAMVLAPSGVHFGKTSGKHSDRFLRTSNVLTNSASCRLLAFFCIPLLPKRRFRQIYVDTSAILSVGLALAELSEIHGFTIDSGKIKSFSSYNGMRGDIDFRQSDLILISASTSGGLAKQIKDRGGDELAIITLFYLQAKNWNKTGGSTLSNLTYKQGAHFGFTEVDSYLHDNCPLCDQGLLLAEFEGDQFLLQRRKTRRLKITTKSQSLSARAFFELSARQEAIAVLLVSTGRSKYLDICFDINKILANSDAFRSDLAFKIRRAVPTPLDLIISDDCDLEQLANWSQTTTRPTISDGVKFTSSDSLPTVDPIHEGGVLVHFSSLQGDLLVRSINRSLRSIAPKGSIGYLATLLVSDSPETRRDLLAFLKYGDRGPNTFTFETVHDLLLSQRQERLPWDLERDHLARLSTNLTLSTELQARLEFLRTHEKATDSIFLQGQQGTLEIANDFVYLNVDRAMAKISQADVYAIVSNLLTACRNNDRDISSPTSRGTDILFWEQSVYGQVLLCPRNFKDFNDGVLHASFLRAAKASELRYDTDETLSEELLEIILGELSGWRYSSGQALAEFVLSIATKRLTLKKKHMHELVKDIKGASFVPQWIKELLSQFDE